MLWSKNWGWGGPWKGGGHATRWRLSGAFSLRRKVAREGLKDLCLGEKEG